MAKIKMAAMVTKQGTACSETALCASHDTPASRREREASTARYGPDAGIVWLDDVDNDALECTVCGYASAGIPPCAAAMGCLCAGHARGIPADKECDAAECPDTDGRECGNVECPLCRGG